MLLRCCVVFGICLVFLVSTADYSIGGVLMILDFMFIALIVPQPHSTIITAVMAFPCTFSISRYLKLISCSIIYGVFLVCISITFLYSGVLKFIYLCNLFVFQILYGRRSTSFRFIHLQFHIALSIAFLCIYLFCIHIFFVIIYPSSNYFGLIYICYPCFLRYSSTSR